MFNRLARLNVDSFKKIWQNEKKVLTLHTQKGNNPGAMVP